MLKRALDHYYNRLTDLLQEYENVNEILFDDLDKNMQRVSNTTQIIYNDSNNLQKVIVENKNIICCALINYITYLESSRKSISEKLAGAKPEFEGTDKEIYLATQMKKEICKT
jgi:hypothetical protein